MHRLTTSRIARPHQAHASWRRAGVALAAAALPLALAGSAQAATLTISPASAAPGETVTVRTDGFAPARGGSLTLGGTRVARLSTDWRGHDSASLKIPANARLGTQRAVVRVGSSRLAGRIRVVARKGGTPSSLLVSTAGQSVALSPTSGEPGTRVRVRGAGFGRKATTRIYFGRALARSLRSSRSGTFSASFAVPEGPRRATSVSVRSGRSRLSSPFSVLRAGSTRRSSPTGPAAPGTTFGAPAVSGSAPQPAAGAPAIGDVPVATQPAGQPFDNREIKLKAQSLPYKLTFDTDHGKIADAAGVGTGFTYIAPPRTGYGYEKQNLRVTGGALRVRTGAGSMDGSSNSQDNAVGVGIDAPNDVHNFRTTLLTLPAGSGKSEQAGLYFGVDQDEQVKLIAISTPGGTRVEFVAETGGTTRTIAQSAPVASGATVGLVLKVDPTKTEITASYKVNSGGTVTLGSFAAPEEFFSFDGAGLDPSIGTRSFGGILATHRGGTPLEYAFGDFTVDVPTTPPPPPPPALPGDVKFTRSAFPVPMPTSIAYAPDGRIYVTTLDFSADYSTIHATIVAVKLNTQGQVVSRENISTLGDRMALGITVDPDSTPDNVILWVSHSSPSTDNGAPNSGMVSKLSGPGFTDREDVITGLPRAKANHAVNSIHFGPGPSPKLYLAAGGNTGAGAPNTGKSEFGTMEEQPLTAALLEADVKRPGFDGTCTTALRTFGPSPCDVVTYATGFRNMYDFTYHSNGTLYGPDNGLGVTGTFPPKPTPECTGFSNPALVADGGHNPGVQNDSFNRIERGKYYGHPNPYRNECVFKTGALQDVPTPANYVPPMLDLGSHKSADGTTEYRSDQFGGKLKGEILTVFYSGGDTINRVKLSADGKSAVGPGILPVPPDAVSGKTKFDNPLAIETSPNGTIYVGEAGATPQITVLTPAP